MLAASFWSSPVVSPILVFLAAALSAWVAILAVRRGNRADKDVKQTADSAGERDRVEMVMEGLTSIGDALRADNKELRAEVTALKAALKSSVEDLSARIGAVEAANTDLRTRERELERENGALRAEAEERERKIEAQALRIAELEARVLELEKLKESAT